MNKPPYFLTDVFADISSDVKSKLILKGVLTELNYQFGYLSELVETLSQMKEPGDLEKKFPLIYLHQPFQILRGEDARWYGTTTDLKIFIINQSSKQLKAKDRMEDNFKQVLYPIYDQLLESILESPAILSAGKNSIPHVLTDRYWWNGQQSVLNDVVDCMELSNIELKINNNKNQSSCTFTSPA